LKGRGERQLLPAGEKRVGLVLLRWSKRENKKRRGVAMDPGRLGIEEKKRSRKREYWGRGKNLKSVQKEKKMEVFHQSG